MRQLSGRDEHAGGQMDNRDGTLDIGVIGSGISGLSAAWLLSRRHRVSLYESASRFGGHGNTVEVDTPSGRVPVDTGFIVYNEAAYPNLTALFAHLGVATNASVMTLAVSLDDGRLEYGCGDVASLFAQRRNLMSPRFLKMLWDLARFYREAPGHANAPGSLGDFLDAHGYGEAFQNDHLLPMAAAVWSASATRLRDYPAASFIRFCDNHGLLKLAKRPVWRTVAGGSRVYIDRLIEAIGSGTRLTAPVVSVRRTSNAVSVRLGSGETRSHDHVVIASHADQALAMLETPSPEEERLLGAFRYSRNVAVLHSDPSLMPKRRAIWSSWNYFGGNEPSGEVHVTYWMNRLQNLSAETGFFVTLNPAREPAPDRVFHTEIYHHPQFDKKAMAAQRDLWSLQGKRRTWFCGAWFGAGFHEDGIQAGLAIAEQLGGVRRPWTVPNESGRIHMTPMTARVDAMAA